MLQVYLARHCLTYQRTASLLDHLKESQPQIQIQVINLEDDDVQPPDYVLGSPVFVWNEQVISLGNPSAEELLEITEDRKS